MSRNDRIVIVGGGPAGLSVARAYREMGGRGRLILLTAEPDAPYRRPPLTKEYLRGEIPREDVAATFVAALETPDTGGKTFEILSGDTPIKEALERL